MPRQTPTSGSLIAGVRQRDEASWRRLLVVYSPLIDFWCRKLHVPVQDIPDVSQAALQAVATNIDAFRRRKAGDSFRAWLRTIVRSKAIDYHRARAKQPAAAGGSTAQQRLSQLPEECTEDYSEEFLTREESLDASLRSIDLRAALEYLEGEFQANTWRAFWLVVIDGRTPAEAGQELGMTAGAVRVAKCRVLSQLRREVGEIERPRRELL